MPNLDLDDDFIKKFFSLTGNPVPANVTSGTMRAQLDSIAELVRENRKKTLKKESENHTTDESDEEEDKGPAILVVDDLGVITYQLKVLLSKFNLDVDCSQEIYDAVNKFKRRKYMYVVMDLFIPTEREGFILLTELRKLALSYNIKTIIGVITASPRKEIEQQCKARGADFFLEKNNEWQNTLLAKMGEYIETDSDDDDF